MERSRKSFYPYNEAKSEGDRSGILETLNEFNAALQTWQGKYFVSLGKWGEHSLFIFILNSSRMNRLMNWLPWEMLGLTSNSIMKKIYSFYQVSSALVFLHPALHFLSSENIPKGISLIGKTFHTGSVDLGTQFSPSCITQSYPEVSLASFLDALFRTSLKESTILKSTQSIL